MSEISYYEYKKMMGIDQQPIKEPENKLREITYGTFKHRYINFDALEKGILQIESWRTVYKHDVDGRYLVIEWTFVYDITNYVTYAFVSDLYRWDTHKELPAEKQSYFFRFRGITDDFSKFHGKKFEAMYQKIYDKIFTTPVIPIQEENKDTNDNGRAGKNLRWKKRRNA